MLTFFILLFSSFNITIVANILIDWFYTVFFVFCPKPKAQEKPLDHRKKPLLPFYFCFRVYLLPLGGNVIVDSVTIANSFGLSKFHIIICCCTWNITNCHQRYCGEKSHTNTTLGNILSIYFNITLVLGLSSMISHNSHFFFI